MGKTKQWGHLVSCCSPAILKILSIFKTSNARISKTIQDIKISSPYLESAANFTLDRIGFVILSIVLKKIISATWWPFSELKGGSSGHRFRKPSCYYPRLITVYCLQLRQVKHPCVGLLQGRNQLALQGSSYAYTVFIPLKFFLLQTC